MISEILDSLPALNIAPRLWRGEVGLLRGREFSKTQLRDYAAQFGHVEANPYPEHPDAAYPWIYRVSADGLGYDPRGVAHWHYDGANLLKRSRFTLLYAECGLGVTMFCDAALALAGLPPQLERQIRAYPDGRRPRVQTHPDTGQLMLQTTAQEGGALSEYLDGVSFSHQWRDHDLVVFDNAAVLHRATRDVPTKRVIYRVTTAWT